MFDGGECIETQHQVALRSSTGKSENRRRCTICPSPVSGCPPTGILYPTPPHPTPPSVTCICVRLPAVMFEMVQHASLRIDSFVLLSWCMRHGSAEQLRITCVWMSSPVTMLPTARSAADTTLCDGCLQTQRRADGERTARPTAQTTAAVGTDYIDWIESSQKKSDLTKN